MTTIAVDAKRGEMVCDSRVQTDTQWWPAAKVRRIGNMLVGGCGDTVAIAKAMRWLESARKSPPPKITEDICLLTLGPDGLFYWSNKMSGELIERGFHAIGSGGNAALGAMMAGATPKRAVEIASLIDVGTGGDVVVHKLKA